MNKKRKNIWVKCDHCGIEVTVQNIARHLHTHINPKIKKIRKFPGKANSEEAEQLRRQKISETMKKNPKAGGLRVGSGRGKKQWYESSIAGNVYIRSSYELEYVKWLDKNNIKWKSNLIKFPYYFAGKFRYYYPDFYLIDTEEYIEIKGYKTEQDIDKWKAFPYKLRVIFKQDLLNMGLDIPKW